MPVCSYGEALSPKRLPVLALFARPKCLLLLPETLVTERALSQATAGKMLDRAEAKPHIDVYFNEMRTMAEIVGKNPGGRRLKFMLHDIIALRQNGWIPARCEETTGAKSEVKGQLFLHSVKESVKEPAEETGEQANVPDALGEARDLMKKLTPNNLDEMSSHFSGLDIEGPDRLSRLVEIIFERALEESSMSHIYGAFCKLFLPKLLRAEEVRESAADIAGRTATGPQVTISEKFDGSFGVGFLWQGNIVVCSRRRMTSEQAVWATAWAERHLDPTSMDEGWTYLFEILYPGSRVVTSYLYEGLVLLSATDPVGTEVGVGERVEIACAMGIPHAAQLACFEGELNTVCALTESEPSEGWVVQKEDGTRYKVVHERWQRSWVSMQQIQPLLVWEAARFSKPRTTLPSHGQLELDAMCRAMQQGSLHLQRALLRMFSARQFKSLIPSVEASRLKVTDGAHDHEIGAGTFRGFDVVVSPFQEAFVLADALAKARGSHENVIQREDITPLHLRFLALRGGVVFVNCCDALASQTVLDVLRASSHSATRVCFRLVSTKATPAASPDPALLSQRVLVHEHGSPIDTSQKRMLDILSAINSAASSGVVEVAEYDPFANLRFNTAHESDASLFEAAVQYRDQFAREWTSTAVGESVPASEPEGDTFHLFVRAAVDVFCEEHANFQPDQWDSESWKAALRQALAQILSGDVVCLRKRRSLSLDHKLLRVVLHDALLSEHGGIRGYVPSPSFQSTFCKSWPTKTQPRKVIAGTARILPKRWF